jgi:hypothetical protein
MKTDDDRVINIRDEIATSQRKICELAEALNPRYKRTQSQTIPQLLDLLLRKKAGTLTRMDSDRYLGFYNAARFASPNQRFEPLDYANFLLAFNRVVAALEPNSH